MENNPNVALFGELGGIPPIVRLLASGMENSAMVKAVSAAVHLLRNNSQNKIAFCECGGRYKLDATRRAWC